MQKFPTSMTRATAPTAVSPSRADTGKFGKDLTQVAQQLRSSLVTLMTSVGLDPEDQHVLNREWGIAKTLSWKIRKVIETEDPFLALQQLPGKDGIEILLKKGAAAGVQARFVEATKNAVDQFDQLIKTHCGDRETFEIMGSDVASTGRLQRDEQHRKLLFQGASHVLGVQARVSVNIRLIAPSAGTGGRTSDMVRVAGLLDFRRLRSNVSWVMYSREVNHDDGTPLVNQSVEAIDPSSAGQILPIMPEFCSRPTPGIDIIEEANKAFALLRPGEVGNEGMISYVTGAIDRGLPLVRTPTDQVAHLFTFSDTPTELLVFDLYVHESMTYAIPPQVSHRSLSSMRSAGNDHEKYQLPLNEPLIHLGSPTPARVTPEVPRYSEILDSVFARTGWSPSEFRGFRIKMAYPPVLTVLAMRYPLPDPIL
jgi:hypothetical protein